MFDREFQEGLARFQIRNGLRVSGFLDSRTYSALNVSAQERLQQLQTNLARVRSMLSINKAPRYVLVNVPAFTLQAVDKGNLALTSNVVVGKPTRATPRVSAKIVEVNFYPTWTVPESIEVEEIAPKGPGYLARNNMVRRNGRIVQLPGPENSLGQVKFDMKNDHAIYLHDTPAKALFAENERHRSHGCIRVEDALGFAQMLAGDDGVLPAFQEAMLGREEEFVEMKEEVPVRLLYHTVFLDGGALHFRTDAYGWDEDLAAALSLKKRTRRPLKARGGDIGP